MLCKFCGKSLAENSSFCKYCGKNLITQHLRIIQTAGLYRKLP